MQRIETISVHNTDGALISTFPDTQDNIQDTNYRDTRRGMHTGRRYHCIWYKLTRNILQSVETISIHNADGSLRSSFPDTQDNSQDTNYTDANAHWRSLLLHLVLTQNIV